MVLQAFTGHPATVLLSGLADDPEELLDGFLCFAAGLDQLEGKVKARYETQDCHDPVRDRTRNDCPCYAAKQHQSDGEYQSGGRASVPFLEARGLAVDIFAILGLSYRPGIFQPY